MKTNQRGLIAKNKRQKYIHPVSHRFHGTIIKSLKNRQALVEELHIPLTSNMSYIQTCLLDIINYTVKQLKSINRTIDMQVIVESW